jgi:hypothetical protein
MAIKKENLAMRIIPTWLHGMLDYPLVALLIALPWLGGFADNGPAMWVPIVAGIAMLIISSLTAYETGIIRMIPVSGHLAVDAVMGIAVAASPWLFGFADTVYLPHLILGLGEVAAAAMTQTHPQGELTHHPRGAAPMAP